MKTTSDPVTLQLINNAFEAIVEEMALTIARTAFSTVVRDNLDYSTAFLDRDGRLMAQGTAIPFHLGAMTYAIAAVQREYGSSMKPGDVYILNDPYDGGTHLPDIYMFKPVFDLGERIGYAATIAHQTDMGGRVAGSNASDSTEIYQEGLRIPPLPLYQGGKPNRTLFDLIARNVRVPDKVLGDLRAQHGACVVGEKRFFELRERMGRDTVSQYASELLDYSERLMRQQIKTLPDGVYRFTDYIDEDGINPDPIPIEVAITVNGGDMRVDFTGTAKQVKGAINSVYPSTYAAVLASVRSICTGNIPNNEGMFRPIEVIAPMGCLVNPELPAPVAARGLTLYRICDTVCGALAEAAPKVVPAASDGGFTGISCGGYTQNRRPFVFVEFFCNAWGGRPGIDGIDGVTTPFANMANTPVEVIEATYPLRIEQYAFVPDTGGPGEYRGGLAAVRDFRLLEEEAIFQVRSDRRRFPPYGLQGGKPGKPSENYLNPEKDDRLQPAKMTVTLRRGDLFRHVTAGGGGFGDPLNRRPESVLEDVRAGKVSPERAMIDYGVIIVDGTVDEDKTLALRAKLRDERDGKSGV